MRTLKDEDCTNYKEAPNAATTEIRKSKRSYEQNFACYIKHNSKRFYACVICHMSGVNKTYEVGPLKDNITRFLMAEELKGYLSVY